MLKKRLETVGTRLLLLVLPFTANAEDLSEQLLVAARKSDVVAVKALLAKGADVNAKTSYGVTVLSFAADRGSLEIVKILLDHGADINATDNFYHMTIVERAASKGYAEIVGLLLEKGATGADGALEWAVFGNHLEVLKVVLEKGKVKEDTLSSALAEATKAGNGQITELLKKAGAAPPPKADFEVDSETLKTYAGIYRNKEEIEIFITLKEGKLTGGFAGQGSFTLGAINRTTFRPTELAGMILIFNLENGKVTGLTVQQGDALDTFQKVAEK